MSRELLILRHAKSAWDTGAPTDFERPLAPRGRRDAPRVGEWLRRHGLRPDHVVSSPAERARQTVLAVCAALDFDAAVICWEPRIYHGSTSDLLQALRDSPEDAKRVLIAGHNPGLESLLLQLCARGSLRIPPNGKLMPTAAVARLEIPVPWGKLASGAARLLSLTRPRDLKA